MERETLRLSDEIVVGRCSLFSLRGLIMLVPLNNGVNLLRTLYCDVLRIHASSVLGTSSIKLFVLDEADEMLSRGFKDQIHDVFKTLSSEVQVKYQIRYEIVCERIVFLS